MYRAVDRHMNVATPADGRGRRADLAREGKWSNSSGEIEHYELGAAEAPRGWVGRALRLLGGIVAIASHGSEAPTSSKTVKRPNRRLAPRLEGQTSRRGSHGLAVLKVVIHG
jgi:hypothetical protein